MPPSVSVPHVHPVSQIVTQLLEAATNSSNPTPPTVIDVDGDFDVDNQQDILVTKLAPLPAVIAQDHVQLPNVHSAIHLQSSTVIDPDASFPCTIIEEESVAIDDDNHDEDDDDVQIVSTAITQPIQQPISLDSDSDSVLPIVDVERVSEAVPAPSNYAHTSSSISEVIVCTSVNSQSPSTSAPVRCASCNARVLQGQDRQLLSRCKHVLCTTCHLRCVVEDSHVKMESHESAIEPEPPNKQEDDNMPYEPLNFCKMRNLPVCIVSRCAAPLSHSEAYTALVSRAADDYFAPALEQFEQWLNTNAQSSGVGPAHISFPSYEPEGLAVTADSSGDTEPENYLLEDDLQAAYAPLWAWDEEYTDSTRRGAWLCLACGEHDTKTTNPSTTGNDSPPSVDGLARERYLLETEHQLYAHCAFARALGAVEMIRGLADARDGKTGKRKRRAAATRRRYTSAASLRASKRQKTGFAKGTGYAGRSGNEWKGTSSKMLEEKARMDQAVTYWLLRVRCFIVMSSDAPLSSWPGFMRVLLRKRGIVAHLSSILISESIMDILDRFPVFVAAMRVVHAICDSPPLRELATDPGDGDEGKTIAELVDSLSRQAALLSTGVGVNDMSKSTEVLIKQIRRCIRLINRHGLLNIVQQKVSRSSEAVDIDSVKKDADEKLVDMETIVEKKEDEEVHEDTEPEKDEFETDKKEYIEQMKAFQFQTVPGLAQTSSFYSEALASQAVAVPAGSRQRRIAGEVASLFSSLPLSWSSTILLRADEDRYDFLRAAIFGPEDTPYDSGAFLFDIWLPLEYPSVPPKFRLLTTGSGRVRFNPNLYNNGKVCLSLLGTWSGPSWSSASTILQVLVSIQSLILVPDPYFNEPGYEKEMGTESGKKHSISYNERVRKDCAIYAIQYNIKHPSPDLAEGITTHFRLKRRYIKHVLKGWFPFIMQELDKNDASGSQRTPGVTADPDFNHMHGMPSTPSLSIPGLLNVPPALLPSSPFTFIHMSGEQLITMLNPHGYFGNHTISASNLRSIFADLDNL